MLSNCNKNVDRYFKIDGIYSDFSSYLISTSHHDRPFAKREVLDYLEDNFGFKICMHERDFTVGDTIPANIEVAVNHSRRMIMILSRYSKCFRPLHSYFI